LIEFMTTSKVIGHLIVGLKIGGTERMLQKTLPALNSPHQKHIVYNFMSPGPIGLELTKLGVDVYDLDMISPTNFFPGLFKLYRYLISHKVQVLTTYFIYSDLVGRVIGRLAGIRRIYCFQRGALLNAWPLRIFDFLTKSLVDKYLFVSQVLKDRVSGQLHLDPARVLVIPNGISDQFKNMTKPQSQSRLTITNIGIFKPKKGQIYLLNALPLVETSKYKINCNFLGAGPLLIQAKETAGSIKTKVKIIFLGEVKNVFPHLINSDIFVFTSLEEGMSNALLEAMVTKCAIVAHKIPENYELLGGDALYADILSPESLSSAINKLIKDPALRFSLGSRARQRALKKFSLKNTISLLNNLYSEP